MKLYGHPGSTCTRKVLTTLHEKGLTAEFINVDITKMEQKSAAHLARQPFGVVPVLDDDGFQIYESRAVIRYLDRKFPPLLLTPSDVHAFGRMEQWMSIEASYFSLPALTVIKDQLWKRPLAPQGQTLEQAVAVLEHTLDVAEKHLLDHAHMAGESFSLADISWMPYVEYLALTGPGERLLDARPHVSAWWKRVSSRASWQQVSGRVKK